MESVPVTEWLEEVVGKALQDKGRDGRAGQDVTYYTRRETELAPNFCSPETASKHVLQF